LIQVTEAPTGGTSCGGVATECKTLVHLSNASTGYNAPSGTFTTEPLYGYAAAGAVNGPAVVMRMGTAFEQQGFAIYCNTLVQYNAFSVTPSCTTAPLAFGANVNALATEMVLMQAQYGISNTASSNVVSAWVSATGTWAAPAAADVQRIKAVRVVLVSRSKEPDSDTVTQAACTNGAGVVNTGPCNFEDASAPVIDLSGLPVPGSRSWRQYRYRVQQAVIPLRNVIWSNG
jgi:type IV pilus assembly protein PilW